MNVEEESEKVGLNLNKKLKDACSLEEKLWPN